MVVCQRFEESRKCSNRSCCTVVMGFAVLMILCISLMLLLLFLSTISRAGLQSTSTELVQLALQSSAAAFSGPQNSFLALEDSDACSCAEFRRRGAAAHGGAGSSSSYMNRSFADWLQANASDEEVMCAAHQAALRPLAPGKPRVAFLFMVRGPIPHEPVWRQFFQGHEELYSIYVHAAASNSDSHESLYPNNSIFNQRQIPSKPLSRFGISMTEAQRRLLAYALLDNTVPNSWFSLVCESSVPVRSFGYVYNYLMNSELSFVEAFFAWEWWRQGWVTTDTPQLQDHVMRKGEAWFSVHRRHAGLIVGDFFIFPKFKEHWREGGISAEIYLPTLLNIIDPFGIANRSTTYVNWTNPSTDSHPETYTRTNITDELFVGIQNQTRNTQGMYVMGTRHQDCHTQDSGCIYNGVANASCWLFARKFSGEPQDVQALLHHFTNTVCI